MKDQFGREITYLRLSVTDLCNLRCVYCMPEEGVQKMRHEDILSIEEIAEIVKTSSALGIKKVRITGGEPLVRRGITEICRRVSSTPGIEETCLTTNGTLLPKFARELREAGVRRLNISLDSLDPATYSMITRGGKSADVLRGIDAAREAGFETIKVNAVLIGGVNEGEIRSLAEMSREPGMHIRFIELMPIGGSAGWAAGRYIPGDAVLAAVGELMALGTDGVARTYALPGAGGTVGIISPVSRHFCPECNRIRVTSDGKLKPCLHSAEEINLRGLHGEALAAAIGAAIWNKPCRHALDGAEADASASNGAPPEVDGAEVGGAAEVGDAEVGVAADGGAEVGADGCAFAGAPALKNAPNGAPTRNGASRSARNMNAIGG